MEFISTAPFFELWLASLLWVGGASIASTAIGIALERALGHRAQIWTVPLAAGQLRSEMLSYGRFVLLLATLAALWLKSGAIVFGGEGAAAVALTFALLWTSFEVYYYGLHRALHSRALFPYHAHHHASHVTTAWSGQSLGWVEALGWILGLLVPPAVISFFMPVSLTGFLLYFVANTFVNLVGHANVELNPLSSRNATWLNHPWVYHALHHARFKNNYSFASTFMDRLFGTEWSDWPSLHARVWSGDPMTRLSERGSE